MDTALNRLLVAEQPELNLRGANTIQRRNGPIAVQSMQDGVMVIPGQHG